MFSSFLKPETLYQDENMNIPAAQRTIETIRTLYAVVQEEVRQFQQPKTLLRLRSNVKLMEIQANIGNLSAAL